MRHSAKFWYLLYELRTRAKYAVCPIYPRPPNQCWLLLPALWSFRIWPTLCRGEGDVLPGIGIFEISPKDGQVSRAAKEKLVYQLGVDKGNRRRERDNSWRFKRRPFVIRSNEGLTLETSAIVSFTASITLINTQLIHQKETRRKQQQQKYTLSQFTGHASLRGEHPLLPRPSTPPLPPFGSAKSDGFRGRGSSLSVI